MLYLRSKKAFTMLELVFVIVILGIVASIGSQIIVQVYESYIIQRATYRSTLKTELVTTQLANRLAYSVPSTVIARTDHNTYQSIVSAGGNNFPILEWIGYDADGFGVNAPLWSGYMDVDTSTIDSVSTPGSALTNLSALIGFLSGVGAASSIADAAILFPDADADTVGFSRTARNVSRIHPVAAAAGTAIALDASPNRDTLEHYKLAWTAYAVVRTPVVGAALINRGFQAGDVIFDLSLHYDYQPWDGENYSNGSDNILIRNVSVFRFTGTGDTIRLKLCQREPIDGTFTVNTCKEKAIIR